MSLAFEPAELGAVVGREGVVGIPAVGAVVGLAVGAVVGLVVGAVVGAVVGLVVGIVTGAGVEEEEEDE